MQIIQVEYHALLALGFFIYKVWFILCSLCVCGFCVFAAGWELMSAASCDSWAGNVYVFGTRGEPGGAVALAHLPEFWGTLSLLKQH